MLKNLLGELLYKLHYNEIRNNSTVLTTKELKQAKSKMVKLMRDISEARLSGNADEELCDHVECIVDSVDGYLSSSRVTILE